jgi:hypothetical protein
MADQPANSDRPALPLAQAAARFGITTDALRMRFRRGRIEGYRRGRRLFIYVEEPGETRHGELPEADSPSSRARRSEQGAATDPPGRSQHTVRAGRADSRETPAENANTLNAVVELQRAELDRLLRDNGWLHQRLDELMTFQEREQVLRQQMQGTVDRLTDRLTLPAPSSVDSEAIRREARAEIETALKPVLVEILEALARRGRQTRAAS